MKQKHTWLRDMFQILNSIYHYAVRYEITSAKNASTQKILFIIELILVYVINFLLEIFQYKQKTSS